jgi:hypothetical protein
MMDVYSMIAGATTAQRSQDHTRRYMVFQFDCARVPGNP